MPFLWPIEKTGVFRANRWTRNSFSRNNAETGEAAIFKKNEDGSKADNVTPPGFGRIAAQTAARCFDKELRSRKESCN